MSVIKFILNRVLAHPAWAGLGVLVAVLALIISLFQNTKIEPKRNEPPVLQNPLVNIGPKENESPVPQNSLISKFVIAYFENSQSEDVSYFFADRVDYYSMGIVSRNIIRQDAAKHEKKWPNRTYKVVGSPQIEKVGSTYIVNTTLRFALANYKRVRTGRADNILKIQMINGTQKIVNVRETVTLD